MLNVSQSLESLGDTYAEVFSRHGHTEDTPRFHASGAFSYGGGGGLTPIQGAHLCSEIGYRFALSNGRNSLVETIRAPPPVLIESRLWALALNIHKWLFRFGFGAADDLLVDLYLREKFQPQGVIQLAVPLLDVHSLYMRIKAIDRGQASIFEYYACEVFSKRRRWWERLFGDPPKKRDRRIHDLLRPSGFVHWEAVRTFMRKWGIYRDNEKFWLQIHDEEGYREEFPFIVLGGAVSEVDNESVGDVIVDVFLHQCDQEAGIVRLMQSDRIAGWHASVEAPPEYRSIYDHPDVAPHYRSIRIRVPSNPGVTVLRAGDSLLITYSGPDDFIEIPIEDSG